MPTQACTTPQNLSRVSSTSRVPTTTTHQSNQQWTITTLLNTISGGWAQHCTGIYSLCYRRLGDFNISWKPRKYLNTKINWQQMYGCSQGCWQPFAPKDLMNPSWSGKASQMFGRHRCSMVARRAIVCKTTSYVFANKCVYENCWLPQHTGLHISLLSFTYTGALPQWHLPTLLCINGSLSCNTAAP